MILLLFDTKRESFSCVLDKLVGCTDEYDSIVNDRRFGKRLIVFTSGSMELLKKIFKL
jgi:hypothetical protein